MTFLHLIGNFKFIGIAWFIFNYAAKAYLDDVFIVGGHLAGVYALNVTTEISTARTLIDCARHCQHDRWCNSFAFHEASNNCTRQRMFSMIYSGITQLLEPGWLHYRFYQDSSCPQDLPYVPDRLTSTCYRFHTADTANWTAAKSDCLNKGSNLAVLEPVEKAEFAIAYVNSMNILTDKGFFVGAIRDTSEFPREYRWVSGQRVNMSAIAPFWDQVFATDSSRQTLVLSAFNGYRFRDAFLSSPRYFVCERPFAL